MSEDEDCDDLPMITVNAPAGDSSTFAMPSAEEVASQRARELACEEELLRLRALDLAELADSRRPGALTRSDSSGSEADAQPAPGPAAPAPGPAAPGPAAPRAAPAPPAPPAAALWAALAPRLPPPAPELSAAQLDHMVTCLTAKLANEEGEWADEEILCACALLCVALLAHESRSRRRAARALHALLDDHATAPQESQLSRLLLQSFPSPSVRLRLCDALRSGGAAGADRLAAALTCATVLQLLRPHAPPPARATLADVARAAGAWRAAPAAARYACVQLVGRALAAEPAPAERAALLAHLSPPAAAARDLTPDRLEVRVRLPMLLL